MKKLSTILALGLAAALPFVASAQSFKGDVLGDYLSGFIDFINKFLIPFIWAIAFIVFIWGMFQYFIAGGANEEQRDKGKQLAFWGIIAFVVMTSLWGFVNLLVNTLDFRGQNAPPIPTFQQATNGSKTNTSSANANSLFKADADKPASEQKPAGSGNADAIPGTNIPSNLEGLY